MFSEDGPSEDNVRKPTLPAFLEVDPGSFKPLTDCTRDEIESQIMSRTMQAAALIEEAKALDRYLDGDISV